MKVLSKFQIHNLASSFVILANAICMTQAFVFALLVAVAAAAEIYPKPAYPAPAYSKPEPVPSMM